MLLQERFPELQGKRVGLITNHTGSTREGRRNIDAMIAAGVNLKALYSPEHGLAGKEDQANVANDKDSATGSAGLEFICRWEGPKSRPEHAERNRRSCF